MDDTLQELENELKRLRPRAPSAALLARIESDLAVSGTSPAPAKPTPARVIPFPYWLGWRGVAASAAVVAFATVLILSRPGQPGRDPAVTTVAADPVPLGTTSLATPAVLPAAETVAAAQPSRYQPVGAASVLYDLREDGKVNLNDRTPARRLRYRYVDTYTWRNPATNASLKWSVPRDEVRVLPASLH